MAKTLKRTAAFTALARALMSGARGGTVARHAARARCRG